MTASAPLNIDPQFWTGFIMALAALGALILLMWRLGLLPVIGKGEFMTRGMLEAEIKELKATVKVLQADHVSDAAQLTSLRKELTENRQELAEAKAEIKQLKLRLAAYENQQITDDDFEVLAIFGPDQNVVDSNLTALRQSGIRFKRLLNATKQTIQNEIQRKRDRGEHYPTLFLVAHAGPDGFDLADGKAARPFWSNLLMRDTHGTSIVGGVFLAGCTDITIADWLIEQVDWVFSTHEDILVDLEMRFVREFFAVLHTGRTPRQAYQRACTVVPQFAESTDFRERITRH